MEILRAKDLSKSYPTKKGALKGLSFVIKSGEVWGVVGPNGSGKTTLTNCMLGLIDISGGKLEWDKEVDESVFLIPDKNVLPEYLTGREYLDFICKLYERPPKPYTEAIIDKYDMRNVISRSISDYSFGMKKKIQIIAGCSIFPSLLVLDEPFRGLDIESVILSKGLLRNYAQNGGAILLSSHDVFLVEQLCSPIMMLYAGRVKAVGSAEELKERFDSDSLEEVFVRLTERDIEKDVEEIFSYQ